MPRAGLAGAADHTELAFGAAVAVDEGEVRSPLVANGEPHLLASQGLGPARRLDESEVASRGADLDELLAIGFAVQMYGPLQAIW